jgi:hypothetical protein
MPFLVEKKLIIPIASYPFAHRCTQKLLSQQKLNLGNGACGSYINAPEAACPRKQMKMRVDEPWENRPSSTREELRPRGNTRAQLASAADSKDSSVVYRDSVNWRSQWIKCEHTTAIQQQVSGKRRHPRKTKK